MTPRQTRPRFELPRTVFLAHESRLFELSKLEDRLGTKCRLLLPRRASLFRCECLTAPDLNVTRDHRSKLKTFHLQGHFLQAEAPLSSKEFEFELQSSISKTWHLCPRLRDCRRGRRAGASRACSGSRTCSSRSSRSRDRPLSSHVCTSRYSHLRGSLVRRADAFAEVSSPGSICRSFCTDGSTLTLPKRPVTPSNRA